MRVIPLTLKQANALVDDLHRHHKPVRGHRFSLGLIDDDEILHGSVICGRPVARGCDPYLTLEVTRLVTDGTRNACSILYAAAARTAQAMGFDRIQTYTLETEDGASLRGSGWVEDGLTAGGQWTGTNGKERRSDQPTGPKRRWVKTFAQPQLTSSPKTR